MSLSRLGKVVVSTNIGTYNDDNRIKLHDDITEIEKTWGKVDFILLQELNWNFGQLNNQNLPPFFDQPPKTNANRAHDTIRGVGTFGPETSEKNKPREAEIQKVVDELQHEFLAQVFETSFMRRNRNEKTDAVLINAYGNHTKKSIVTIETELKTLVQSCKELGLEKIIITGDMNDETVEIEGFHELRHPELYHKDRIGAQKKNIDKVLCNFDEVKILEIRQSLESKSSNNPNLGHKVIVFGINTLPEPVKVSSLNYGRLLQIHQAQRPTLKKIDFKWKEIDEAAKNNDEVKTVELLEEAGTKLYDHLENLIERATTTKSTRCQSRHATLQKATEGLDENLSNQKKAKSFFQIAKNLKNGIERANQSLPELSKFVEKLEDKLKALETVDEKIYDQLINECYQSSDVTNEEISKRLEFPSRKEFDRIMLTVNKSGASDYAGVTTKATILLYKKCPVIRAIFYELFKRVCFTGHIPTALKRDKIVFLWKRKGSIYDVSNYRPITHAPAVGKHFEKLTKELLNKVPDKNAENHAYAAKMSIFTAITELIATIQEINRMNEELPDKSKMILPVIIAEDISGAFECLPHLQLERCITKMQELDRLNPSTYKKLGCKIDKLTRSYLDRKASVYDDKGESLPLELIPGRSSPQGSSNSPKFWRIHDKIFSTLHHLKMKELLKTNKNILKYSHFGFSDDHVTVIAVLVDKVTEKAHEKFLSNTKIINKAVVQTRLSLKLATETCGSKINAAKTEIVTAEIYAKHVIQAAPAFKWLGNTFELSKKFELKMSEKQLDCKIAATKKHMNDMFSYFKFTPHRLRIYKVYINPIIDFFLLQYIMNNNKIELNEVDKLSNFQHFCLARVLGTYPEALRKSELQNALQELNIPQKAARTASQLSNCPRVAEIQQPLLTTLNYLETSTRHTRNTINIILPKSYTHNHCFPLKLLTLAKQHTRQRKQSATKELIIKIGKLATKLRATRLQTFDTRIDIDPELFELKDRLTNDMITIWPSNNDMMAPPIFGCSITSLLGWVSPV